MNQLAVSLAGHDKDSVYVIVGEEERVVLLADGKARTLQRALRSMPISAKRS